MYVINNNNLLIIFPCYHKTYNSLNYNKHSVIIYKSNVIAKKGIYYLIYNFKNLYLQIYLIKFKNLFDKV